MNEISRKINDLKIEYFVLFHKLILSCIAFVRYKVMEAPKSGNSWHERLFIVFWILAGELYRRGRG